MMSVGLASFRKIHGYDTFDSIRTGNRNEKVDPSDYYNVSLNIMVRRNPAITPNYPLEVFDNGKTLKH